MLALMTNQAKGTPNTAAMVGPSVEKQQDNATQKNRSFPGCRNLGMEEKISSPAPNQAVFFSSSSQPISVLFCFL
jgi:hypothetical protein